MICRARHSDELRGESTPKLSGLEQYLAGLNVVVGDGASTGRALMVEIRVAVADATGAHVLVQRLAGPFDLSCVSLDQTTNEICVRSEWEARAVVQVIDTVESWLAADGLGSATLSLGDRSYTMVGQA